jgi:hypothetical protein
MGHWETDYKVRCPKCFYAMTLKDFDPSTTKATTCPKCGHVDIGDFIIIRKWVNKGAE